MWLWEEDQSHWLQWNKARKKFTALAVISLNHFDKCASLLKFLWGIPRESRKDHPGTELWQWCGWSACRLEFVSSIKCSHKAVPQLVLCLLVTKLQDDYKCWNAIIPQTLLFPNNHFFIHRALCAGKEPLTDVPDMGEHRRHLSFSLWRCLDLLILHRWAE